MLILYRKKSKNFCIICPKYCNEYTYIKHASVVSLRL